MEKKKSSQVSSLINSRSNKDLSVHKKKNLWSGILFGIGLVAFIDETVFHQILHWHHFYDKSTTAAGLVSDGIFHAFSWFFTVGGLFMVADVRRRKVWQPMKWVAGGLLGAGGFQLYDGIIQHKLMRLHQIRYHVDIVPYDMVWHITSVLMLIIGIILFIRSSKKTGTVLENGQ
ncbi:DUF2243 domain-containing protein [Bacillus sp. USDA818B3_A]|uniref:DUF2243 domain-containing protein n=1 Tax=Bacillus sp. USDA818B3_A TaxID=2698834 RepID=UPI0013693D15|nr:DUF2243 domain-containing protein [Bacillus sp. USDA818B3_A]